MELGYNKEEMINFFQGASNIKEGATNSFTFKVGDLECQYSAKSRISIGKQAFSEDSTETVFVSIRHELAVNDVLILSEEIRDPQDFNQIVPFINTLRRLEKAQRRIRKDIVNATTSKLFKI